MMPTLYMLVVILGILEVYQRISNHLNKRKQAKNPYTVRFETASGTPVLYRGGSILSVHHPHLIHRLKAGQKRTGITVNAQGFRGSDWDINKSPSSYRIIVLGNSTVFGQGTSSDDKVFTDILERRLNSASPQPPEHVEILNAGVTGYTSTEELILLATELINYHPKMVMIMDGWFDLYVGALQPPGVRDTIAPIFPAFDQAISRESQRLRNILRLSALFRMLEERLAIARRQRGEVGKLGRYSDNLSVYLPNYERNLRCMVRLARAYGSEVIIAPQPELFQRSGNIPASEQEVRKRRNRKRFEGYADFVCAQYPAFIEAAREVALAEGVHFVDATKAFDHFDGAAFTDFVHLTDEGNEVLAHHLLPTVSKVLTCKSSRSSCQAALVQP